MNCISDVQISSARCADRITIPGTFERGSLKVPTVHTLYIESLHIRKFRYRIRIPELRRATEERFGFSYSVLKIRWQAQPDLSNRVIRY